MGQQEYQAGANMAFKAFGIVDQMQQRQMMQQLQEQQMGQQVFQRQLIQAQVAESEARKKEIEDKTKRLAATDLKSADYSRQMGEIFNPKQTADIETGNIQSVYPTMNQDMMSKAMGLTAQYAPPEKAMGAFGDIYEKMQQGVQTKYQQFRPGEPIGVQAPGEPLSFITAPGTSQKPPTNKMELTRQKLIEEGKQGTATEIYERMKQEAKGYDTEQEAFNVSKGMVSQAGANAALLPGVELTVDNKWIPKPLPDITKRIPEWTPVPGMPGVGFTRRGNKFVDSATNKELTSDEIKEKYGEGAFLSAMKSSLQVQERGYGMMDGFVRNLKGQVDRMKEITKNVQRFDARLLNVPLIEWRTKVKGTAYENIINMYVTEISTEMGKIASGSQASVRELSVQTREKWEKIHDFKLPVGEMIKVLEETSHAADIRVKGAKEAITDTRKRLMDEFGFKTSTTPGSIPKRLPNETIQQWKTRKGM